MKKGEKIPLQRQAVGFNLPTMKAHMSKARAIRKSMAVFNYDGRHWIVVRGFKGTAVLGRFTNQRDAQALCEQHNVALAKAINS